MIFNESVNELRRFIFVNLNGKIDDHIYHRLAVLIRSIKNAHQDDMDEQYMKAFEIGLKSGCGIESAIHNATWETET